MSRRPPERCIYCDEKATLTKEHIFGEWLKRHVTTRSTRTDHYTSFGRVDPASGETIRSVARGRLHRPGAPHSHQMKLVCKPCNNHWLSGIQSRAQPHLLPLMRGGWPEMDGDVMRIIATWAKMVTISLEFADPNTLTTSEADRRKFMAEQSPGDWQVYVGRCEQTLDPCSFWHRAALFSDEASERIPEKPNTQTTTFYFGRAFFHTVSAPEDLMPEPPVYADHLGIRQFWPIPNATPKVPLVFTPEGVNRVSTAFWLPFGISPEPHFGMIE